jgi:N-acetylmuramoyl-L-alanine amidase
MLSLNESNFKILSSSPDVIISQEHVDSNNKAGMKVENLIIRGSGGPSLPNAVRVYLDSSRSIHLIIERNGKDIAQLVDFNRVAAHAQEYDVNSLGIELVYPGYLIDRQGTYRSKDRYDPSQMIFAQSINEYKMRWWPLFPPEQLDILLEAASLFEKTFDLKRILLYDEINQVQLAPGPAFPINRLRQLVAGDEAASRLFDETIAEAEIFLQPGKKGPQALEGRLPEGTPVAIVDESGGWVRIEVLAEVEGQRWLVGWIEADKIGVKEFVPKVNENHLLVADDSRAIRYLAPYEKNFNPNRKLEPRYVVIHTTTGVNMNSTINWFRSPVSGVSAHLLVGRDGRVVQFVPFHQLAFHCGTSTWEGDTSLNQFAIGIEVDNAGYLVRRNGRFFKRKDELPENRVTARRHWREQGDRSWEKFPDRQIQVVVDIVKALKDKYPSIQEVVGHDMINLINRTDPGPLYPLGELRKAVLGKPDLKIKAYQVKNICTIYTNFDDQLPNPDHPSLGELPDGAHLRVKEVHEKWSLVTVKDNAPGNLMGQTGWIPSDAVQVTANNVKLKGTQTFYKLIPASKVRLPPMPLKIKELQVDDKVRVQYERDGWALVAPVLEFRKAIIEGVETEKMEVAIKAGSLKKNFIEGWVKMENLEKI